MTYDEMNSFILNYIKNDITGRAICLPANGVREKAITSKTP